MEPRSTPPGEPDDWVDDRPTKKPRGERGLSRRDRARAAFETYELRPIDSDEETAAGEHIEQIADLMTRGMWLGAARREYADHYGLKLDRVGYYATRASDRVTPDRAMQLEKLAAYTGSLETIAASHKVCNPRAAIDALGLAAQLNGLLKQSFSITVDGDTRAVPPEVEAMINALVEEFENEPDIAIRIAKRMRSVAKSWRSQVAQPVDVIDAPQLVEAVPEPL